MGTRCIDPLKEVTGLILAGGQGRRMGGQDKGLVTLAGRPLISFVHERLTEQVAEVLISANRHLDDYRRFGGRVVSDGEPGYHGPLMGIYSGLRAATTPWVMVVPCDTPLLPADLVTQMASTMGRHHIAVAHDGERLHPVVMLLQRGLAADLGRALAGGERKIRRWIERHSWIPVQLPDGAEAFINLNTEEDKQWLETRFNQAR